MSRAFWSTFVFFFSFYYFSIPFSEHQESDITSSILGLNLLYLLVENRLSDFHCEVNLQVVFS